MECPSSSLDTAERSRIDALRQRIFAETARATTKGRLFLVVPFSIFVPVVLALGGMSPGRVLVQVVASVGFVATSVLGPRSAPTSAFCTMKLLGLAIVLLSIGNTGGLVSPLILLLMPFLMLLPMAMPNGTARAGSLGTIATAFVIIEAYGGGRAGALVPGSGPYLVLAGGTLLYTGVLSSFMGRSFAGAHERLALELATRREELCTEGADRTLALEGVAARMAHEVKNPLAAIKGLSTHMARRAVDPEMAERLAIVAEEADRLQAIVDGFLSFSRGLDDLRVGRVQPLEVARELTLLLEARAAESGVLLEASGDEALTFQADGRKIRQALLNLVLNALQASRPGGRVRIVVSRHWSRPGVASGDPERGAARIRVEDEGAGMTAEVLERIRRPYFTTREGGSGLGVAVARGLVEQHGGTLTIESAPGRGTVVIVELPAAPPAAVSGPSLPNPLRAPAVAAME